LEKMIVRRRKRSLPKTIPKDLLGHHEKETLFSLLEVASSEVDSGSLGEKESSPGRSKNPSQACRYSNPWKRKLAKSSAGIVPGEGGKKRPIASCVGTKGRDSFPGKDYRKRPSPALRGLQGGEGEDQGLSLRLGKIQGRVLSRGKHEDWKKI